MITKKIVLASKSPRRKFLLEQADFDFRVVTQDTDESYAEDMNVEDIAGYLSGLKAQAVVDQVEGDEIIIAADTIVISDDLQVLGKPTDQDDAKKMLIKLSDSIHRVITGVTLLIPEKEVCFSVTSVVHFDELSLEEVDYYVNKYKPYDKAGSYGIQDWIGWCKIKHIEGSYSNIMGLPMNVLYRNLLQF